MRRTILVAVLLMVPVFAVVLKTSGQGDDRVAKERWEYLVVAGPSSSNFSPTGNSRMRKEEGLFGREAFVLEQHIYKLGASGWELVSVAGGANDPVYYFKRAK